MKKIFCFLLGLMFFIPCCFNKNKTTFAYTGETNSQIQTDAKSSILIDAESGVVLQSQNETMHLPIASMTKIMTLLIAFEEIDKGNLTLNQMVLVSENASGMGGSQVFLDANEQYKLSDLIKSIIISSANDASVAVAELICGDEQTFVSRMNAKAKELKLENTNFENCTGLPSGGAYSCAKDVATMFSELIKHENYFNFSKIYLDTLVHPSGRETELSNTNKLVRFYAGCDGGKTGSTSEAKFCLCATAKRANLRVIACVIGCENSKIRNAQVSNLFNFAFNNFTSKTIINCDEYFSVPLKKASKESIIVGPEESFNITCNKTASNDYQINQKLLTELFAPINKGDKIGEIEIIKDGEIIKTINIVAKEGVGKKTYGQSLKEIFSFWSK